MLLQLPTELVERCVEFAVFPINPINTKTLLSLLLTCRALYKLTIPYLYDSHILYINRNLYTSSAESRDYRANLYPDHPPPSFVPPTALHTLLLLPRNEARSSSPTPERYLPSFPSNPLITIFNQLTALKTLVYIPKNCSRGLVASINALPLTSLTCPFDCNLLADISIERPSWRLRSLTLSRVYIYPPKLQNLLRTYTATLIELSMSFRKNRLPYRDTAALPKLPALPKLRCLRLLSYDPSVMRALQGSVDFGRLETLQLVGRSVTSVVSDSLKEGGGLSMLRKLSVQMLPGVLVAVLEMCTAALEELHVVWIEDEESTGMTAAVAEVMARRCKGLKAVSLDLGGEFQRVWGGCEMAMKGEDLEVVARGCTGIEDLYLSVDMHVFASTTDSLPLFSALRRLYLKLHDSSESIEYDSIPLHPLVTHPWHFDPPLDRGSHEDKVAATAWALDQVVAKQRLDYVSVVVLEDPEPWIKAEWVKPGLKLAGNDLHLSELRRCMTWFPVTGIGRWNMAFEPVWFGDGMEETGVLICGN